MARHNGKELNLTRAGSHYTDEQKREAIAHYALLGNVRKVGELTNIPAATIYHWRDHADWWEPLLSEIRKEKQDEIDAKLGVVIDKAIGTVSDRLENGQKRRDSKGNWYTEPVSMRDAMWTGAVAFDKQRILRNLPTTITQAHGDGVLRKMAKDFDEISRRMREKLVSNQ